MELRKHKQVDAMYQPTAVLFTQQQAIQEENAPTLMQLNREMYEVRNITMNSVLEPCDVCVLIVCYISGHTS